MLSKCTLHNNIQMRLFTGHYYDNAQLKPFGRYSGKNPRHAAHKAFSAMYGEMNKQYPNRAPNNINITFYIADTETQQKYYFIGRKEKLDNPVEIALKKATVRWTTYAISIQQKLNK